MKYEKNWRREKEKTIKWIIFEYYLVSLSEKFGHGNRECFDEKEQWSWSFAMMKTINSYAQGFTSITVFILQTLLFSWDLILPSDCFINAIHIWQINPIEWNCCFFFVSFFKFKAFGSSITSQKLIDIATKFNFQLFAFLR